MSKPLISSPVIKRLPRYYRFLGELEMKGITRISSGELSLRMGFTASQIRQDFNCFGGFGQQGYGYNVSELKEVIGKLLGISNGNKIIMIGAGNLGKAIASHIDFPQWGFKLMGIFDSNPQVCGQTISDLTVLNINELEKFCEKNEPVCAALCIPEASAEELVPRLIQNGIKSFWNFSHYDFYSVDKSIIVKNIHLADSLMTIAFGLNNLKNNE